MPRVGAVPGGVVANDRGARERADPQRELLDVDRSLGTCWWWGLAFLAAHRGGLFPDSRFADLFRSSRGRPSVPVAQVATVLMLQSLHGLSDRDAADAVTFDLRWKAACGLPVTAAAFHATTLTYWRRRLAASERPHRVFETVREVINRTGVVAAKTRRALDSTVLDDAVATQDTVTQLVASIRRVARVVPGGAQVIAQAGTCSGYDVTRPGKPAIAWDDPDARAALIDGLVRDALAVLAVIGERVAGGLVLDEGPADAVGRPALVAGQDVELVGDSDGPGR